jgi:hypothetical protein
MGFPPCGWKVGISAGAFPIVAQLSPLPTSAGHRLVCIRPSCIARQPTSTLSVSDPAARQCTAFEVGYPPLRAPHSGPGCSVPVRHRLFGPIRPTRRHTAIHCLAAYARCLRCAGAPRRPASGSGLSFTIPTRHAIQYDPGEFDDRRDPVLRHRYCIRRDPSTSALCDGWGPKSPQPQRAFTSRLPGVRSPSLPFDLTTACTGLLCLPDPCGAQRIRESTGQSPRSDLQRRPKRTMRPY